ncbi:MAG: thioredoxin [Patescibacteria group bacterium]
MAVQHISQADFQKVVLENEKPVLVDFYAEWCGPCKMTEPIVDELSNEMSDMVFVKIDVDKDQELASEYSVFSIPTFMIFKKGKVAGQFVGAMGKEGFLSEIKKAKAA